MRSVNKNMYDDEPWAKLARQAGFEPVLTETASRYAFEFCAELIEEKEKELAETNLTIEKIRPLWAQGHSSDSTAAQSTAVALSEIWHKLGVSNQTEAMSALSMLLKE